MPRLRRSLDRVEIMRGLIRPCRSIRAAAPGRGPREGGLTPQPRRIEDQTMSRPETTAPAGPTYAPPSPTHRTSRMAIWSLILSILWLGGLGALAGIALGISARRRIALTGERGAG